MTEGKSTWRFPRAFWTGNGAELCERAAYYGTFIALRTYLIRAVGLDDVQAGVVAGLFGGWIYLMPVSYTHLRAHETVLDIVCRLLLENKKILELHIPEAQSR